MTESDSLPSVQTRLFPELNITVRFRVRLGVVGDFPFLCLSPCLMFGCWGKSNEGVHQDSAVMSQA